MQGMECAEVNGAKTVSEEEFSIEIFVQCSALLTGALGLDQALVLRWSMGASAAMGPPGRPQRVDKLVLHDGGRAGRGQPLLLAGDRGTDFLPRMTRKMFIRSMFPDDWNEAHLDLDELFPWREERIAQENTERLLETDERWPDRSDRLDQIRCPTVMINGTQDLDCSIGDAPLLARRIEGAWPMASRDGDTACSAGGQRGWPGR